MKKARLIYFGLGLAIMLGVIWIMNNNSTTTVDTQLRDFAVEDTSAITKIFLADKADQTILLERLEDNSWLVNGEYKARQDVVNNLLGTMKTLTLRAPVSKAMFENVVKRLAGGSVKVEIYQNGENTPMKVYYVGSANQDHTGTFMLLENSTVPFVMHVEGHYGFLGSRYTTRLNDWRDNSIWNFKGERLKNIASIKLEKKYAPEKSFEIRKEGEDTYGLYTLSGRKVSAVQEKLRFYIKQYEAVAYEGFEETKRPGFRDSILTNTPIKEVYTLTDVNGNTTTINTYDKPMPKGAQDYQDNPIDKDMDRMYGLLNNEEFVVIQYYVFDPLNLDIEFFQQNS